MAFRQQSVNRTDAAHVGPIALMSRIVNVGRLVGTASPSLALWVSTIPSVASAAPSQVILSSGRTPSPWSLALS